MIELLLIACASAIVLLIAGAFLTGWVLGRALRPRRRRGSNPPPYCKPQPPSGPPQPLTADLIRYARWRDQPILNIGRVQRGNGSGEPTLPKLDIVPKPQFPSRREIPGDTP